MIEQLPQLCSTVTPRKENTIKTTLSRRLVKDTLYKSEEESSLYPLPGECKINLSTRHFPCL